MISLRRGFLAVVLAVLASGVGAAEWAAMRPVKLVVPFPAGSGTDVVARLLAERLRPALGQAVIIENKAGASGNIGTNQVAKSAPDGYTLLMHITFMPLYRLTFANLPYDGLTDFTPIGTVADSPMVIAASMDSSLRTAQDFITQAASRPLGFTYGSSGLGSPQHIAMEQLARAGGLKLQHVPYKGISLALTDLLGKQIDLAVLPLPLLLPQLEANKLRAIVSLGATRSSLAPDIPTLAESGVPDIECAVRFVLLAPARTPPEAIARLNAELNRILRDPAMRQALAKQGLEPQASTPEEARNMMRKEFATLEPVIRSLNLEKR